jgi:putative methyltransferase (TIGR04325 family)
MNIRDFIPPILLSASHRLRSGSGRKQYASYHEALADCSQDGYENRRLVEVVVQKTLRYKQQLLSSSSPASLDATSAYSLFALLLAAGARDRIHVLDFGGAAGAHYLLARALLPPTTRLNWLVVETPEMVNQATPLLADGELRFCPDLGEAAERMAEVDLLHSSGTLQCVPNPHAVLKQLLDLNATYVLLNRLGVSQGDHDVITVQHSRLSWNGPGPLPAGLKDQPFANPFVFPRESIMREILQEAYREIACFPDPSGVFPVRGEPITGLGLLAVRRPSSGNAG